jgi:hypothetical protein
MAIVSESNTYYYLNWVSQVRSHLYVHSIHPFLDFEAHGGEYSNEPGDDDDVYYKEQNLSRGDEGMDYRIVYKF